jgi:hypothetical protein
MVLEKYDYTKEGIDTPSSCALRCRGIWAGVMAGVAIRTVISHEPSGSTHTFRNTWLYSTPRSVAILLAKQDSLVRTTGGECYGDKVRL